MAIDRGFNFAVSYHLYICNIPHTRAVLHVNWIFALVRNPCRLCMMADMADVLPADDRAANADWASGAPHQ